MNKPRQPKEKGTTCSFSVVLWDLFEDGAIDELEVMLTILIDRIAHGSLGCFASCKTLGKILRRNGETIQLRVNKLLELEVLRVLKTEGRKRWLEVGDMSPGKWYGRKIRPYGSNGRKIRPQLSSKELTRGSASAAIDGGFFQKPHKNKKEEGRIAPLEAKHVVIAKAIQEHLIEDKNWRETATLQNLAKVVRDQMNHDKDATKVWNWKLAHWGTDPAIKSIKDARLKFKAIKGVSQSKSRDVPFLVQLIENKYPLPKTCNRLVSSLNVSLDQLEVFVPALKRVRDKLEQQQINKQPLTKEQSRTRTLVNHFLTEKQLTNAQSWIQWWYGYICPKTVTWDVLTKQGDMTSIAFRWDGAWFKRYLEAVNDKAWTYFLDAIREELEN